MCKMSITLACTVEQEVLSENGAFASMVNRERCFTFFIQHSRRFLSQSDLDHWIDFAQGFLKNHYNAKNVRVTSISSLPELFMSPSEEYTNVLDFKYLLKSWDIE